MYGQKKNLQSMKNSVTLKRYDFIRKRGLAHEKAGNKKLLKSNRISGFQKADHQKLPIDKTRRIISQKFHFFKIFKVGLIGALIFGILFELALEHVPGLLLWSIYGIIVTVILKEIWDIVKERYKSTDEYKNMMSSSQSPWQKTVIVIWVSFCIVLQSGEVFFGAILMLSVTGGAVWQSVHEMHVQLRQ